MTSQLQYAHAQEVRDLMLAMFAEPAAEVVTAPVLNGFLNFAPITEKLTRRDRSENYLFACGTPGYAYCMSKPTGWNGQPEGEGAAYSERPRWFLLEHVVNGATGESGIRVWFSPSQAERMEKALK